MSQFLVTRAKAFKKSKRGATMIEYGLIVVLIALVAIVGLRLVGVNLNTQFSNIATTIANPH